MDDRLCWEFFDKYNYISEYICFRRSQIYEKLTGRLRWPMPRMVAGRWLLSTPKANEIIGRAITDGAPFWAGRFGDTELKMVYQTLLHRMHPEKDGREAALRQLCTNAGFFPYNMSLGEKFSDLMLESCAHIDLLGEWGRYMEDYIYVKYQPHTRLTQLSRLEPWNMYQYPRSNIKPWSYALKGKKVLVVHPFEESIRSQYEKNRVHIFERIYDAEDILPEFELNTLKAVQTIAGERDGRFSTWFEALTWMVDQCRKSDFDVAIIGCGAYGFPLADEIKRMGKTAIHLGGATQLMFGILGRRWEDENAEFCRNVVNEYWTRPLESERVAGANQVEQACYW